MKQKIKIKMKNPPKVVKQAHVEEEQTGAEAPPKDDAKIQEIDENIQKIKNNNPMEKVNLEIMTLNDDIRSLQDRLEKVQASKGAEPDAVQELEPAELIGEAIGSHFQNPNSNIDLMVHKEMGNVLGKLKSLT